MRLIQSNPLSRDSASLTPASVFEKKYDWLLRWAMHFTQNDRHAAEDLVQDTFVRLIVSWPRIKDNLDQAEPFLYSTLKYAHLMESRRGRRFNFQNLALIEFDDLRLSLKEENDADPIEVQDDLRRIVAYLCWRKRSAKSASVLLLRFFHGYFAEEIVRIVLLKRNVVDKLLSIAREEVKAYLADPARVEIMRQGRPPEVMPRQVAVPAHHFAEELRNVIFEARTSPCLSRDQLARHYQASAPKAISCELLAHIVSCKRCLEEMHSGNDLPSLSERSEDSTFDFTRRARRKPGSVAPASKDEIRRSIAGGMSRFRNLYEHHPRGLMIVVNGDVLAMRDVNSATSELKVQTAPEKALGIIEVLSEQGVFLLTLHVPSAPPEAPPELHHEIALSDNRTLALLLRFTSEGALIELRYNDPLFLPAVSREGEFYGELEEGSEAFSTAGDAGEGAPRNMQAPRGWWKRLLDRMNLIALPEMNPMLATAVICAMASIVFLFLSFRSTSVMKPEELLKRASGSEAVSANSGRSGVVVQMVSIQTPHRKMERTLYRDLQGRRRVKEVKLDADDTALRVQLEAAGISWNDPLSPVTFRDWHDHELLQRDEVKRTEKGLLTLTATVSGGIVASESLTVREADFHAVEKTVTLRNAGMIEIAELSYSILPWSSVNPDLFEPLSVAPRLGGAHATLLPRIPAPPTAAQIDAAELEARLVLNRLHMDDSGRIELSRQANGIHVQGVVETEEMKHQLQSQLYLVPHVLPNILTVREMETRPSAASDTTSIRQSSVAADAPSAMERYFTERGIDRNAVTTAAQQFVDSSFTIRHESQEIADLLDRFSSNGALSSEARIALSELLIQHKAALLAALGREERQLVTLQLIPHPASAVPEVQGDADTLMRIAQQNFVLCVDLTSGSNASSRSAQAIAPQLADSIAQLRAVVLHISAAAQLSPPSSGNSAISNQNK